MKKTSWSIFTFLSAFLATTVSSQVATGPTPIDSSGFPPSALGKDVDVWQGRITDWHSTEWQMTQTVTNPATGHLESQVVRHFTELGGGINYISDITGAWERSSDAIDLMTNMPGAAAVHGPTKVFFSPTLGADGPTIRMVSCSNVVLQIQPTVIYYEDDSGNSAILATLRPDAQGELLPPNRVVYRSVTTNGLAADLVPRRLICWAWTQRRREFLWSMWSRGPCQALPPKPSLQRV
jgi:hypothetical protein